MARFLVLWRTNPAAPWPTDPVEVSKFVEKTWAVIDDLIKKGEVKEHGLFLDRTPFTGYDMYEGEATDVLRFVSMLYMPYYGCEVREIIPYEKEKEILRAIWKAQAEAVKK